MARKIQAVRGMNDIVPDQTSYWRGVEQVIDAVLDQYGYQEIRLPIVESTQLFHRGVGEVTDIVEKETYTFDDRNGDSLTLRPEGTAGCVRAAIEQGLLHNQTQRLWYRGPMFRHERPQKGRYRQFYQVGVEIFGFTGPDVDIELLALTARWWQRLGLSDVVTLQINTLGSQEERQAYREVLVEYFSEHQDQLDEDSQRRLHKNPLRILDSKNPAMAELIAGAPDMQQSLGEESKQQFATICQALDALGIAYEINPRLVRGLDYYTHLVFEWVTDALGAQGTVCAGGRYDGLVEQLGGKPTPAIGCAMGLERLILLLQAQDLCPKKRLSPDVYIVALGEAAEAKARVLAEKIRTALPTCRVLLNAGGGGMKAQFKRADKSGAKVALILAEEEVANQQVTLKPLQGGEQKTLSKDYVMSELTKVLYEN